MAWPINKETRLWKSWNSVEAREICFLGVGEGVMSYEISQDWLSLTHSKKALPSLEHDGQQDTKISDAVLIKSQLTSLEVSNPASLQVEPHESKFSVKQYLKASSSFEHVLETGAFNSGDNVGDVGDVGKAVGELASIGDPVFVGELASVGNPVSVGESGDWDMGEVAEQVLLQDIALLSQLMISAPNEKHGGQHNIPSQNFGTMSQVRSWLSKTRTPVQALLHVSVFFP
jgi:hypothetical protein